MRKYIPAVLCLLLATCAFARLVNRFTNWNDLIQRSPDVVIARCTSTLGTSKLEKPFVIVDGLIPSEIEVLLVLKGNTTLSSAHMLSTYWPHPGEKFLLIGTYEKDSFFTGYGANEAYQIVPLKRDFQTNMLGGQTLEEKINWVLQSRLRDLNEELAKDNEEKTRLEQGLKMPASNPPPATSH
jgi:hypothetical protein